MSESVYMLYACGSAVRGMLGCVVCVCRRRSSVGASQSEADSEDSEGEIDEAVGREWPSNEVEGIARQREFYQVCLPSLTYSLFTCIFSL